MRVVHLNVLLSWYNVHSILDTVFRGRDLVNGVDSIALSCRNVRTY